MSKHSVGLLFAALFLLPGLLPATATAAPAADLKIATVSMKQIFEEYYNTKEADARFKARKDEMDVKQRELIADAKNRKSEWEALSAEARDTSLNDAERNKKQAQAETKFAQTREAEEKSLEFDKACRLQLGDQINQLRQQIVTEIRGVIQAYIKDRGITLVLDSSGKTMNNVEAVLIADKSFDITDAILAIINKDAPPAAVVPETPTKK